MTKIGLYLPIDITSLITDSFICNKHIYIYLKIFVEQLDRIGETFSRLLCSGHMDFEYPEYLGPYPQICRCRFHSQKL